MVGDLIMLPVRVGVRATQLWLRAAEESFNVAASVTGRVVGFAASRSSGGNGASASAPSAPSAPSTESAPRRVEEPPAPATSGPEAEREDRAAARAAVAAPVAEPPPPAEPTPAHVSEEPELVEEFAEPGAGEGAGPEIHIEEPWDGYSQMNAKQIVSRLGGSSPAELAAVQLYESSHRARQTILNAVQRELRSSNGRGT